jgi:chromosomal replication initiator protein
MRAIATISQLNPLKRKIEINFIRPEPIIVENAGLPPVMFVSVGKNAFPWDEPPPEKERVLIADVQHAVCEFYGISRTDLLSQRRHTSIVRPRQISMYLAKKITFRSFPQIGRQHGWRDWSTAIHAVRRIEELMQADGELADEVAEICGRLEA